MMWWLLIIPAVLLLVLIIPISLNIFFDGDFKLSVGVLCFKFTVPLDKKTKKNKKSKPPKEKKPVKTDGEGFATKLRSLYDLVIAAKTVALRSISVTRFKAHITVVTEDPCSTALLFGTVNALVYAVCDILCASTKVKKTDIKIGADYNAEDSSVLFDIVIKTSVIKFLICLILALADGTIKLKD